ncbi:hypothetical protein GCM10007874_00200 [Labrys miyagiensis]|uniref:TIR domain-containing protein n=1 Tax=Labrys miyagiensis TaxID=346912 RepID=A0ABQ6CDY4_9HYPH|nr:toll/interleukin-1 receptor domain-containing protein [Labrys miyagiensis]GLS17005.1 hypothetical protein GCM10007874_00200 [Labrys miyagiensis]
MARIFISHSTRNDDTAVMVKAWLADNGWTDVFLDRDPVRGIAAGERWKDALQKAAHRCEVVIALVSNDWLVSTWCKSEVDAARLMGKKIIALLIDIERSRVPPDLTDEQFIDLTGDPSAFARLKEGLKRAGLDPTSFPFREGRRPYPGFAWLEEEDAAVFFGRDAQIVRGLDEIRRLVRTGVSRMLVIIGASGSGKSSFMRAGLWPRLKRDDQAWLPLPIIRPERAAISGNFGLVQALYTLIGEPRFAAGFRQRGLPRSRLEIQYLVEQTEDGLGQLLAALREIAQEAILGENVTPPTIILTVDQGEELFNREGREEAERLIAVLTKTLTSDSRTFAVLVVRSDSFPLLQVDPHLAALPKDAFTLDTMLQGSYRAVIEGPATLVQPPLTIDPRLTDALLEDISGQDALPLLAFTLAHLYENTAVDQKLTISGYDRIGRVKGVIDKTVVQAFAEGVARGEVPRDEKAQLALARSAFLPHLAQINAAGVAVRHVAARNQIPAEASALIDRFADQRLLIRDRRKDAAGNDVDVVEVAHEALLRQPPFSDWLTDDREFLVWRDRLSHARAAFEANERGLLTGRELTIARNYIQLRAEREIEPADRAFIQDSSAEDNRLREEEAERERSRQAAEREEQERRIHDAERIAEEQKKAAAARTRTAWVAFAGLVIAALVATIAIFQYFTATAAEKEAKKQTVVAEKAQHQTAQQKQLAESAIDLGQRIAGPISARLSRPAEVVLSAVETKSSIPQAQAYLEIADYYLHSFDVEQAKREIDLATKLIDTPTNSGDDIDKTDAETVSQIGPSADAAPNATSQNFDLAGLRLHRDELLGDCNSKDYRYFPSAHHAYELAIADSNIFTSSDPKLQVEKDRISVKDADIYILENNFDHANLLLSSGEEDLLKHLDQTDALVEMGKLKHMRAEIGIRKAKTGDIHTNFADSESYYRHALSKAPTNDEIKLSFAEMLTRRADYSRQNAEVNATSDYEAAFRLYKSVLADDPTSQQATVGLEYVRYGERKLGVIADAEKEENNAKVAIVQAIDDEFSNGIGKFHFGMTPVQVNALLSEPFGDIQNMSSDLPDGAEYEGNTYIWKYLRDEPELALPEFKDTCTFNSAFVVFLFSESGLIKIGYHAMQTPDACPSRSSLVDSFASRFGLIATGSNSYRGFSYQDDTLGISAKTTSYSVLIEFTQR